MAFMTPGAEHFTVEQCIETDAQGYRCEMCGTEMPAGSQYNLVKSGEGYQRCLECEPAEAGWYGNLSANGYMDRTDYMGPYATSEKAIKEVMDFYEVDADGDDLDEDDEAE